MSIFKIREKIANIFIKVSNNEKIEELYYNFMMVTLEATMENNMEKFVFFLNYENTFTKLEQICLEQKKRKLLVEINKINKLLYTSKPKVENTYNKNEKKLSYKKIINSCIDNIQGINTKKIPNKQYDIIINHFKNRKCTIDELKKLLNSNKKFLQYYNQIPYLYHRFNKKSINLSYVEENQIRFIFVKLMRYIVKNDYLNLIIF